ncbi:Piso0_000529 [Millerozyma farinosa CBS 7064]|uniref:Glucosidase 2 subunit beta n=1 Tax=Pichia sorbitophila (strain ATCC MYA-4447 / BCRC 22081 / CBS 7064 / NBRC 10061 / NRRL Y-12695) TaxID=559304 RepID=G8YVP1_PICSO|nr:Piso0_000529 [Millerozyma farinosa CBS 7064]CCE73485.1 Piso0_000529 [Millerozyma farinosa CBS 7064]
MKIQCIEVFAVVTTLLLGYSESSILGVPPERLKYYEPKIGSSGEKTWACLNHPEIVLSYNQINDDYCDCPDGSDEPGTNACPYSPELKFFCRNDGHFPGYLENYKLNDGVCDYDICCDGTDEYKTGLCPNKCAEVHQQYISFKDKAIHDNQLGLNEKKKLIQEAEDLREHISTALNSFRVQESKLKEKIKNAQIALQNSEQFVANVADQFSDDLRKLADTINANQNSLEQINRRQIFLENTLSHLMANYNPNFNDLAVKEAIQKYQNFVSNKKDIPFKDEKKMFDELKKKLESVKTSSKGGNEAIKSSENDLTPTLQNMVHYYFTKIVDSFSYPNDAIENDVGSVDPQSNDQITEMESQLDELRNKIQMFDEELNKDYGESDVLRSLNTKKIDTNFGGYRYIISFLQSVYQDQNLIGQFDKFENGILYYSNGDKCWNGPHRSANFITYCGPEHKLISVGEPEKCKYVFEVFSPAVCEPIDEKDIKSNFKVDFTQL